VLNPTSRFYLGRHRLQHKNLEMFRDITDDVEECDFVPYAAFYDAHTIITKNGELCQTLKVTGMMREVVGADKEDLRTIIRDSLKRHVPNDSFAIWLHTIRKNTSVAPAGEFPPESFAADVNGAWIEQNAFNHQYVNEVFITIVHEGQSSRIRNMKTFLRGLIPSKELNIRNQYIEKIFGILNNVVENILQDLLEFGAKRLGMYKENGVYYSEQLRFLEKVINFVDRPMPVAEMDLSMYLTTGEITFAFNAMEVRTAAGKRRFGSILTLKEYKEASLPVIDQFMQLPIEFIITQCINFVNPYKVSFEFQEIYNYQRLSEDPDISNLSELTNIIESNRNNPNDFGEQQLTIFLLSDTVVQLEENIRRTIAYFAKYGMVVIREDLKFEETYWAQLPGNFVFVSRMQATNTSHAGGFANLHNLPVGSGEDNHWGPAVTTFHAASGTPYYFNFHVGAVGHTSMVGPADSGKIMLTHFLLTQSIKFNPRIYYLDVNDRSALLMEKLDGNALYFGEKKTASKPLMNPFSLRDTKGNRLFLSRWLGVLARVCGYSPSEEDKNAVNAAIDHLYSLPESERYFVNLVEFLRGKAPSWIHATSPWHEGGKYGHIFTAKDAGMHANARILSFMLQDIMEDVPLQSTVISLILQTLTDRLDGNPTIIVITEGWRLLAQTHISADISGWMDHLTSKNAMLLTIAEDIEDAGSTPVSKALVQKTATQIYMPNDDPCEEYMSIFGLNDIEFAYLELMEREENHFLVRRPGETVVGEMNLTGLAPYLSILQGERHSVSDEEEDDDDMADTEKLDWS
jgi:type IV secretion system protein VirB4